MTSPREQYPFLKGEDLRGAVATVVIKPGNIRAFSGQWGAQVIFDVALEGDLFLFGVKIASANYIALETKFGRDISAWSGRPFHVEPRGFGQRSYVAVVGANVRHGRIER